jgi:hypothetical protein
MSPSEIWKVCCTSAANGMTCQVETEPGASAASV